MKQFSDIFDKIVIFFGLKKRSVNVLMVGLNNSGKSTVVNLLKNDSDRASEIVPTIGLNVEHFKCKFSINFKLSVNMVDDYFINELLLKSFKINLIQ